MTARRKGGTFVPATLDFLAPTLTAESLRETARDLLRRADRLDDRRSRVTFLHEPSGLCGCCGEYVTGDSCPHCQIGARA